MNDGIHTITARPCHSLVEIKLDKECSNHNEEVEEYLKKYYGKPVFGDKVAQSFLIKYYGNDVGQDINTPLGTVVSKDRFGLITIKGIDYQISDIGLRMLAPHELFAAQGFPKDYIIDHDCDGKAYPKTKQVARCGNAVPPPFAEALVRANLPELCDKENIKEVV
jgi:DNA (cytosine-5)-methyltransferase 1